MKFSGHTNAFFGYELGEACKLLAGLGFEGIDIGCNEFSNIFPSPDKKRWKDISALIKQQGLSVSNLACYVGEKESLDSPSREDRESVIEVLKEYVEFASDLGSPAIRIFCGKEVKNQNYQDAFNHCVEGFRELGNFARRRRVTLLIENHPDTMTVSAQETVKMIEAINLPNVRIIYDPANLIVYTKDFNVEGAFEIQKSYINHVHVKDFKVSDEGEYIDTVPGEGVIPLERVISLLANVNYEGFICLEYQRGADFEKLPPPEVGLKQGITFLKGLMR